MTFEDRVGPLRGQARPAGPAGPASWRSCAPIPTASGRPRSRGGSTSRRGPSTATCSAIEEEIGVAVWSEDGRWGVVGDEFLPPLKLTLTEAMAVVLSARLMVRYADKYDPDLAAAFEKLEEVLPAAARGARRADARRPGRPPPRRGLQRAASTC